MGFLDVLKTSTEITKGDNEKDKTSSRLNFFHFKQFIQYSGSFLNEHESFSLETHFYKALSSFYGKLITKESQMDSVKDASEYLDYEKSYIDSYHLKLDGPIDSKIFSESLYNYEHLKTLKIEVLQHSTIEILNALKTSLSNEITLLTESLGDYVTAFELKELNIKYDEDARKVINKVLIQLIEIIEAKPTYSILITAIQLQYYIERVKTNVINFKKELDRINKVTEQKKESLSVIQSKIDLLFEIPFNKIAFEINGITKINCVPNFLKSVKQKNEFDELFGDDKKYTQAVNYRLESDKVVKLITAISDSYNDQDTKAKKQYDDISFIVSDIEEISRLELKIEELLNTNNDA
jgi:hypothetical protein